MSGLADAMALRNSPDPLWAIVPRLATSSSWVIPMPVSRMISCCSASRPSMTISSGPASRWDFVGQRDVPHLVERVGRVRDQLADRDLPALIERMRQKVQKLLDLGLKRVFLAIGLGRHRACLLKSYPTVVSAARLENGAANGVGP